MTSPAPDAAQPDVVSAPVAVDPLTVAAPAPVADPAPADPAPVAAPVEAPAPAPEAAVVEPADAAPVAADGIPVLSTPAQPDPRITKRRVTMRSAVMGSDGAVHTHEAVDYVRPDFLEAYLELVRAAWQFVEVSDEPDAGPAGFDGATYIPAGLNHPQAHHYFPATGEDGSAAPVGATVVQGA